MIKIKSLFKPIYLKQNKWLAWKNFNGLLVLSLHIFLAMKLKHWRPQARVLFMCTIKPSTWDLRANVPFKGKSNYKHFAYEHKCRDQDSNPHCADQKHQRLSPVLLNARVTRRYNCLHLELHFWRCIYLPLCDVIHFVCFSADVIFLIRNIRKWPLTQRVTTLLQNWPFLHGIFIVLRYYKLGLKKKSKT